MEGNTVTLFSNYTKTSVDVTVIGPQGKRVTTVPWHGSTVAGARSIRGVSRAIWSTNELLGNLANLVSFGACGVGLATGPVFAALLCSNAVLFVAEKRYDQGWAGSLDHIIPYAWADEPMDEVLLRFIKEGIIAEAGGADQILAEGFVVPATYHYDLSWRWTANNGKPSTGGNRGTVTVFADIEGFSFDVHRCRATYTGIGRANVALTVTEGCTNSQGTHWEETFNVSSTATFDGTRIAIEPYTIHPCPALGSITRRYTLTLTRP